MIKFFQWLFFSRSGQVLIASILLVVAILSIRSCGKHDGYEKAKAQQAIATGKANVAEHDRQVERNETSAAITKDTREKADEAIKQSEQTTSELKEKVRDAYSKKPATVPVAVGVTVHPVDAGVQQSIERAVNQANATAR